VLPFEDGDGMKKEVQDLARKRREKSVHSSFLQ